MPNENKRLVRKIRLTALSSTIIRVHFILWTWTWVAGFEGLRSEMVAEFVFAPSCCGTSCWWNIFLICVLSVLFTAAEADCRRVSQVTRMGLSTICEATFENILYWTVYSTTSFSYSEDWWLYALDEYVLVGSELWTLERRAFDARDFQSNHDAVARSDARPGS